MEASFTTVSYSILKSNITLGSFVKCEHVFHIVKPQVVVVQIVIDFKNRFLVTKSESRFIVIVCFCILLAFQTDRLLSNNVI